MLEAFLKQDPSQHSTSGISFRTTTALWCMAARWITPSWNASLRSSTVSPSGFSSWCSASPPPRRELPSSPTSSEWHRFVCSGDLLWNVSGRVLFVGSACTRTQVIACAQRRGGEPKIKAEMWMIRTHSHIRLFNFPLGGTNCEKKNEFNLKRLWWH